MKTWITELSSLYANNAEDVIAWLTSKHPMLKCDHDTTRITPIAAIALGREHEVAAIVDQLSSGAHI